MGDVTCGYTPKWSHRMRDRLADWIAAPHPCLRPRRRNWPATGEHKLLVQRVGLHAGTMPIECVREMNAVFNRHYDIPTIPRHLPYMGDD